MEKNPFSIFDFLGYFFPGAFALLLAYTFYSHSIYDFCDITAFIECINESVYHMSEYDGNIYIGAFIFILFSYILGHLIGYLSSITIEKFTIWLYGYPSEFLLQKPLKHHYWQSLIKMKEKHLNGCWKRNYLLILAWRIFFLILLLPISIFSFIGKICRLKEFIINPLDQYLKDAIDTKKIRLAEHLHLTNPNEYGQIDFHRIIAHYEYEQVNNHTNKFNNYVALYDFLRSLSLIFDLVFIYLLYQHIRNFLQYKILYMFDLKTTIMMTVLAFITYLFYMGFIKFYRRYTLEGYMCLVTDINLE